MQWILKWIENESEMKIKIQWKMILNHCTNRTCMELRFRNLFLRVVWNIKWKSIKIKIETLSITMAYGSLKTYKNIRYNLRTFSEKRYKIELKLHRSKIWAAINYL